MGNSIIGVMLMKLERVISVNADITDVANWFY